MKLLFPYNKRMAGMAKILCCVCFLLFVPSCLLAQQLTQEERKAAEEEAKRVIDEFTMGQMSVQLECSLDKQPGGQDSYSYSLANGILTVKASSGVALCRGFYDFVKRQGAGICTWSGKRFVKPAATTVPEKTFTSPYRDHQYMNVVTYGYSCPYWDKARWDKEIDWMALHGVDMPLILIGQEAVYRMVFKDMGLTDAEIDEWEVGPAHLPWMRMGNLAGNTFDGPLGNDWNNSQIELGKYVIDRIRRLGMKPIFPAFGGFVPPKFTAHHSGTTEATGWGWVPRELRNYRLSPNSPAFVEVGRRFVKKWDSIFGAGKYYLSDSFNEMAIPQDKALMTQYGDSIYKSISAANPDATWVMQGWTLSYQLANWQDGIFEALVKNVPDDKFMMLYMATDYKNDLWETYPKFYGKEWVWSVLPNMGGKTAMTGFIENYANDRKRPWTSSNRGNLTGYGFAPEGIENNEILYELITDGGWTASNATIKVEDWLREYAQCRYGHYTEQEKAYHTGLRNSVYNSFRDHPQFGWQVRSNITGIGSVNQNEAYCEGVERLFADVEALRQAKSPLLRNDLIEAAALYCSGKIERVNTRLQSAIDQNQPMLADSLLGVLETLMTNMDRALTCHPLYNLERWEAQAMAMSHNLADRSRFARNARRIVSTWINPHTGTEPVNDYACRVWAGLIRDYYLPRLIKTWKQKMGKATFDDVAFENAFVDAAPSLSSYEPVPADTIQFLADLVKEAKEAGDYKIEKVTAILPSNDVENHWYCIRCAYEPNILKVVTQEGDNAPLNAREYMAAGTQIWRFVKSGTEEGVYRIENRWGQCISGTGQQSSTPMTYTSMANTDMKVVRTNDDTGRWIILPTANSNVNQGLHYNNGMTTWVAQLDGNNYAAASTWTIENVSDMMVPEVISEDYARYMARLNSFDGTEMEGKPGQAKSAAALQAAKDSITKWDANIAHESYDHFLAKWDALIKQTVTYSDDSNTNKLIDMLISARTERQRYKYSDTEVGYYKESLATTLDLAISSAATYLASNGMEPSGVVSHIKELNDALLDFLGKMKGDDFNQPVSSTATVKYGYRMYTPNRGNRYVASNGTDRELTGITDATSDKSVWDFYKRADGTYDIRNRADGLYISPGSANNTALKTVAAVPSAGWKLKRSNADMLFVITSGSNVMFNQTGTYYNWAVFNWGGQNGQNGVDDAGCQYRFVYLGPTGTDTGITQAVNPTKSRQTIYDLSGRRVVTPAQKGIYIVNNRKVTY